MPRNHDGHDFRLRPCPSTSSKESCLAVKPAATKGVGTVLQLALEKAKTLPPEFRLHSIHSIATVAGSSLDLVMNATEIRPVYRLTV